MPVETQGDSRTGETSDPNETRDLTTTVTGSKGPVEGDLLTDGRKLKALTRSEVSAQPVAPFTGQRLRETHLPFHDRAHQVAIGQEAASAQAVNRGRQVTMSEVQDQDDIPRRLHYGGEG